MEARNSERARGLLLARRLAELLDRRFTIPGTSVRIGLDPILGLIPGIGDVLANIAGSTLLLIAAQCQVPRVILLRMAINVAFNAMIGAIPVIGDVFSIWFRSNVRNAHLLERYAQAENRPSTRGDWIFVLGLLVALILLLSGIIFLIVWLVRQAWNFV